MKKFLFLVVVLAAIAVGLMMTCPDRDAHREAIKGVVSKVVNSEMNNNSINGALASIGTAVAIEAVDAYLNSRRKQEDGEGRLNSSLIIRDHTFYNIGVVNHEDEFRMVSVGVFNHVFTISEDDARELIKEKLPSLKK